jgi:serine protease inhibitor
MGKQLRMVTGIIAAALLAAGCASAQAAPPVSRGVAAHEPAVDARPYGAADTGFGLDVLRAWCQADPQQNLVFSPATLATALGMAYLARAAAPRRRWRTSSTCR